MLFVIDDVFSTLNLYEIYNTYNNNKQQSPSTWVPNNQANFCVRELSSIASKVCNLSDAVGFEVWSHYNSRTGWHYDKNEKKYHETGVIEYPFCSIIYYPYVDVNLIGGIFQTEDGIEVKPRTNRAIIMSSGIKHNVTEFNGERFSLLINPWNRNILE